MSKIDKEKILKAGEIAKQVRDWIKPQIKKDDSLLEIANKIESKIIELGARPAFPVNTSINEMAAHYTPPHNDETKAHGLLKVDFGVHIEGWAADNAFSIDLEDSEENKKLIEASKNALDNVLELLKNSKEISNGKIGEIVEATISEKGFSPVVNLSGHSMEQYELHAGITIPNVKTNDVILKPGLYAIEPFATTGNGKVKDRNPSGIYQVESDKSPRSDLARNVLNFIIEEYETLPFCSRWVVKEFGSKASLALRELESNGNLHHFAELVEVSKSKVSQAEHTILIEENGNVIVTTL